MPEGLRCSVNRQIDPDGSRLREILAAHYAHERLQATSLLLVFGLVPVGALVWVAAVLPGLLPARVAQWSEFAWGAGVIGLIIVLVRGRRWAVRARRLAEESDLRDPAPRGHGP